MKKILFIFCVLALMLFNFGCVIDDSTGLIVLTNLTQNDFTNIEVGNRVLSYYIASGAKIDYWYFNDLSGELTGTGVVNSYNVTFKVSYEYKMEIRENDGHNYFRLLHEGIKFGSDEDDDSNHDPVN